MKRILILTILLMSSLAWAGSTTVVVGQGGGCVEGDYLIVENCEGSGTPSGWTNSPGTGGSVNWDYETDPGRGVQSVRLIAGDEGADTLAYYTLGSAYANIHAHFMFRCQDATPLTGRGIFALARNEWEYVYLDLQPTGYLRLSNAGTGASTGTTTKLKDNTWYHIWVDRIMGTGTNGQYRAYICADTEGDIEKPATAECSYDNGDEWHTINKIVLKASQYDNGDGNIMIHVNDYDQVYVDDSEVTDVCE